jgi:DNA topoisomerase VI subunit B
MPSGYVSQSRSSTAVCPSEPESIVKHADGLLQESVVHLARRCPEHLLRMAAGEELVRLEPRFHEALATLEDIEGHRNLTADELARRRAFKMLLAATILL